MNRTNLLRNIVIALIVVGLIFIGVAVYLRSAQINSTASTTNQNSPSVTNQTQNSGTTQAQSVKGKLVILKAVYGSAKKSIDVTKILNSQIINGSLNTTASNSIAGDPDYLTVKTLTVQYSVDGKEMNKTYNEGEAVNLP